MAPKVDPKLLKQEYISTDISIRKLAEKHEMSFSAIAARSRRENWAEAREAFRDSLEKRTYENTAAKYAREAAEIRSETVLAMRATVRAFINQLTSGEVKVSPKDAQGAVQMLNLLLGEPTARTESKVVEFSTGGLEQDVLRRLAELARVRVVEGAVGDSPPRLPERASED